MALMQKPLVFSLERTTWNFGSPDASCYIPPHRPMNGCESFIKDDPVVSAKDASGQDDWEVGKFSANAGGIQVMGGWPHSAQTQTNYQACGQERMPLPPARVSQRHPLRRQTGPVRTRGTMLPVVHGRRGTLLPPATW